MGIPQVLQGPLTAIVVVLLIVVVASLVLWLIVAENKRPPAIYITILAGITLSVILKAWLPVVVAMVGIAFFIFYCHHRETRPLM